MESVQINKVSNGGLENPGFEMTESPLHDSSNLRTRRGSKVPSINLDNIDPSPSNNIKDSSSSNKRVRGSGGNIVSKLIVGIRSIISETIKKNRALVKSLVIFLLFALYNAYLATAIAYTVRHDLPVSWCDGLGFLIVLTGIVYWSLFYYFILKPYCGPWLKRNISFKHPIFSNRWVARGLGLLFLAGVVVFVLIDCWDSPRRLVSASGVLVLLFISLIISKHPGEVRWRQVFSGLAMQFIFGLLVLRWEGGRIVLECLSDKVTKFLAFADEGSSFIYGFTASGKLPILGSVVSALNGTELIIPTTFAFQSLSVIFFFGFVVQLLYHIGAMLWVVTKLGWLLQNIVGTSAAESLNAAANIFLGQTEAPLLIKPFMEDLTKSELHAVMTGGFATIAGTVMAAYISFGVKAESLLSASVMAAPCALALSKLIYPEIEESKTTADKIKDTETKSEGNALDAAAQGAITGLTLIGCIIANILAAVSFVAFLNAIINWLGTLVGIDYLTFQWILGKIFIPVALVIGIDPSESEQVGELLGLKTVVNEFIAYRTLQGMNLSERSTRLAEYALCGFANFSSVGIQIGGLGALAPSRRAELSVIVWRALFAGITASLMNACVAGTLMEYSEDIPTSNSTLLV